MKMRMIVLATLAAAMLVPDLVRAQSWETMVAARGGRGMLGIMTEAVRNGAEPSRQRVIVDVVPNSGAQRAGLAVGDTILRLNGLAASEQVMGSPFEPGDTVILRIRRDGREREVTVVAGERRAITLVPSTGNITLPDSVQQRVSNIMRGVQLQIDTLVLGGKLPFMGDTVFTFGRGDTVRIFQYRGDGGIALNVDSLRAQFMRVPEDLGRIFGDSAAHIFFQGPAGRNIHVDSVHFLRPTEALASGMLVGMRSVAGAELAELNPGLAEYFGAMSGVLVIDAREGTPAARAGLRAGDVIIRVNDTNVSSIPDLRRAVGMPAPGREVRLRVLRHGQPVDVTLGG